MQEKQTGKGEGPLIKPLSALKKAGFARWKGRF
jgi:hypothetical protein